MMTPTATVEAFINAWNNEDLETILALLHPDIFYHNMPMEPLVGHEAVSAYLRKAWQFDWVDWQTLHIAANGSTVLTERVDRFGLQGGIISLPVAGAFDVENGLIRQWRDYFDLADYRAQIAACTGTPA